MMSKNSFLYITLCCSLMVSTMDIFSKSNPALKVGDKAPYFELVGDDANVHKLSDYQGKKVALCFYPKNYTPFCTQEACGLSDSYALFAQNNVVILGISCDSVESHQKFKKDYRLPFTLLSDADSAIFKLYNAKGFFINSRVTYLLNEQGIIIHIFSDINAAGHAQEIADFLKLAPK